MNFENGSRVESGLLRDPRFGCQPCIGGPPPGRWVRWEISFLAGLVADIRGLMASVNLKSIRDYLILLLAYGLFALLCLGWSAFAWPLRFVLPAEAGNRIGRRAIAGGFRAYLGLFERLGGLHLEIDALDDLRDAGPMVLAPNHPGLLDALLLLSRLPRLGCILKADLLHHPLLGAGARLAGYIGNDRRHRMIRLAVQGLAEGDPLLLFPEGTRTLTPPVGAFRLSPALIARKAGVPIQTVLIETPSPFLGKHWPIWRCPDLPIRIRIRLGRRFPPPTDVRTCTAELQRYFEQALRADVSLVPAQDGDPGSRA